MINEDGPETDIVLPDTEEIALKDAIEDNVDMEVQVTGVRTTSSVANTNATIATALTTLAPDMWSADKADTVAGGIGATGDTDGRGSLSPLPSLTSLLNDTSFPLPHSTGIAKSSTCRIKAIHRPPRDKTKIKVVMPAGKVEGSGPGKPHNPYADDIVLFVEPAVLDTPRPGKWLSGLWVQIVRKDVEADN
ncbi:hypothetical protein BDR05DRAFT_947864 [Suillus weaverae]|nr:hypothetical protein BDR05DRAFT_947864 [Suillus weaverae]